MKKRFLKFLIILMVISMVSMACNFSKSKSSDLLGDEYSSAEGGFSFQQVRDFTLAEILGGVEMTATGAIAEVGPGFQIFGWKTDNEKTTDELWDSIALQMETTLDFDEPERYEVDDIKGWLAEIEGEQSGTQVKGMMFLVMVKPDQQFSMVGIAPKDEWKDFEPIFMAVLDSLKFFDAEPIEAYNEDFEEPVVEENNNFYEEPESISPVLEEPRLIRQWASDALASSEYSSTDWSAKQATGAPDVDSCGPNPKSWSPAYIDTEEYIELKYDTPVIPTEVIIYQSNNPSQIVEVQLYDTEGEGWLIWYGDPEIVSDCPDMWTHTIELEETCVTDTSVIIVDQSFLDIGGVEIDAVELVGYPEGSQMSSVPEIAQEPESNPGQSSATTADEDVPTNYSGSMAGPVYQGWLNVIVNETLEKDLDKMMTIPGKKSTDPWKPRADHKQTYLFEMPWKGMTGYISVTTEGVVYKKSVTPSIYPDDYALSTLSRATYDELNAIYNRDKVIPYAVMANMLGSPGFLYEQYYRPDHNTMVSFYTWLSGNRERMSGFFYNGKLTGMAGLVYLED